MLQGADIFASVAEIASKTSSSSVLIDHAVNKGLAPALDALGAAPYVGTVIKAGAAIAKFFHKLAQKSEKGQDEEVNRTVPWVDWDRAFEEDMVNVVTSLLIPDTNWTPLWMPPFSGNFSAPQTDLGVNTRSWGVFTGGNDPDYKGMSGFGLMPGMQQGVDILQCMEVWTGTGGKRRDIVTNAADYRPSSNQLGTGAWQMVSEIGSPTMFQVQPRMLAAEWESWWDDFYGEGLARVKASSGYTRIALPKMLARWLVFRSGSQSVQQWDIGLAPAFIESANNLADVINDDIFRKHQNKLNPGRQYYSPAHLITSACNRLYKRQISALAETVVCALVRPTAVDGLPAFAAFEDKGPPVPELQEQGYLQPNYGAQLKAYALDIRKILPSHSARFELDPRDVVAVDPDYAEKFDFGPWWGLPQTLAAATPLAQVAAPPGALPPQGLAPFEIVERKPAAPPRMSVGKKIVIAGALGYGGYRAFQYLKPRKDPWSL